MKEAEKQLSEHNKIKATLAAAERNVVDAGREVDRLREALVSAEKNLDAAKADVVRWEGKFKESSCPDLEPIRTRGKEAQGINKAVQAKKSRGAKEIDVKNLETSRNKLTAQLEKLDKDHQTSIEKAKLPVSGLTLSDAGVTFNEIPLDQCSGAEKLRVGVAIGIALNPQLKLMLIRDASLLDDEGMKIVSVMAEEAGVQCFLERVDNGRDIGVKIIDGECDSEAVADPKELVSA